MGGGVGLTPFAPLPRTVWQGDHLQVRAVRPRRVRWEAAASHIPKGPSSFPQCSLPFSFHDSPPRLPPLLWTSSFALTSQGQPQEPRRISSWPPARPPVGPSLGESSPFEVSGILPLHGGGGVGRMGVSDRGRRGYFRKRRPKHRDPQRRWQSRGLRGGVAAALWLPRWGRRLLPPLPSPKTLEPPSPAPSRRRQRRRKAHAPARPRRRAASVWGAALGPMRRALGQSLKAREADFGGLGAGSGALVTALVGMGMTVTPVSRVRISGPQFEKRERESANLLSRACCLESSSSPLLITCKVRFVFGSIRSALRSSNLWR